LAGYEFQDVVSIEAVAIPRLARGIVHGARARQEGTTVYLESGEPIL
jgi:8-oxo-dGTP diphosphatase